MDIDKIPIGRDFRKHIRNVLDDCDIMIAVVGPNWFEKDEAGSSRLENKADWIRLEIGSALERDIPVVPLLIDGTPMPSASQLPDDLQEFAYRNAAPLNSRNFKMQMQALIASLDQLAMEQAKPVQAKKDEPELPTQSKKYEPELSTQPKKDEPELPKASDPNPDPKAKTKPDSVANLRRSPFAIFGVIWGTITFALLVATIIVGNMVWGSDNPTALVAVLTVLSLVIGLIIYMRMLSRSR